MKLASALLVGHVCVGLCVFPHIHLKLSWMSRKSVFAQEGKKDDKRHHILGSTPLFPPFHPLFLCPYPYKQGVILLLYIYLHPYVQLLH
jgi:hypothetical protein